jgi:hypothetical protein
MTIKEGPRGTSDDTSSRIVSPGESYFGFNMHRGVDGLVLLEGEVVETFSEDMFTYGRIKRVALISFKYIDLSVGLQTILDGLELEPIEGDQINARTEVGALIGKSFAHS